MSAKRTAPAMVKLRFIGGQRAQYWNRGWTAIKPGNEVELPEDRATGLLANGDWERVKPEPQRKEGE